MTPGGNVIEGHEYLWTDGRLALYVGREPGLYRFRVFTGTIGQQLREIAAQRATRSRDGGTTRIHTDEGLLLAPRPARLARIGDDNYPARPCTFTFTDGRPTLQLPRVDPDDYAIALDQTATSVVVTERRPEEGRTLWAVRWRERGGAAQFRECNNEDEARRLHEHLHARIAAHWEPPQLLTAAVRWTPVD